MDDNDDDDDDVFTDETERLVSKIILIILGLVIFLCVLLQNKPNTKIVCRQIQINSKRCT